ncbi:MAG TPA: MOSC N-terminal beta barrel domain-containing protein [Candidatus Dojkabacteria bacterium]|jgi:uncharacterized protein YcbX
MSETFNQLILPEVDTSQWEIVGYMSSHVKSGQMSWIENPKIGKTGIEGDRIVGVFDRNTGKMITGRDDKKHGNKLTTIQSSLQRSILTLINAQGENISVNLDNAAGKSTFNIWGTDFAAGYYGEDVSDWLTRSTGIVDPVLVDTRESRHADQGFLPNEFNPNINGQDGYPLHIVNLTTLEKVNEHLLSVGLPEITVEQTRANIVIRTPKPFEELYVDSFNIPSIGTIGMPKPCVRCKFTGMHPTTGEVIGFRHLKVMNEVYKQDANASKVIEFWESQGVRGPILGQNGYLAVV